MFSHVATRALKGTGITIRQPGEPREPYDIVVHSERVFVEYALLGSLGFGRSYIRGDWDCDALDQFFCRLMQGRQGKGAGGIPHLIGSAERLLSRLQSEEQRKKRSMAVIAHYNIGNELYVPMLGPTMAYTCGYRGRGATTLEQMQLDKFRLICEKLGLRSGQRVLDIGCGFGSFANFAAREYGVEVVGISLSSEQLAYAREHAAPGTSFAYLDYRNLVRDYGRDSFDHIVSIGMFEAVERADFGVYMNAAFSVLKSGGLFLLHTITLDGGGFDPWLDRYIFPHGYLPSEQEVCTAAITARFECLDVHEFGADYDHTLMAWHENFERVWLSLVGTGKYDERFYRIFRYYLLQCAGLFRARHTTLHQFVLGKEYCMAMGAQDDSVDDREEGEDFDIADPGVLRSFYTPVR